jgi:hypothetical protein
MRRFPAYNCIALHPRRTRKSSQANAAIVEKLRTCYFLEQADSLARVVITRPHVVSFLLRTGERQTKVRNRRRYSRGRATTL